MRPYSNKKLWWTCDQCPDGHLHRWEATVNSRARGNGCPQCVGRLVCKHNCLAIKAPLIAAQWDCEANDGTPDSMVAQSRQHVGWLCEMCGRKWSATPHSRLSKKAGCPKCSGNAKKGKKHNKHPTFACSDVILHGDCCACKGCGRVVTWSLVLLGCSSTAENRNE